MEIMPNDTAVIEHLGDVYLQLNRLKEAQEMYEKVLKIDPENKLLQKKLKDLLKKK